MPDRRRLWWAMCTATVVLAAWGVWQIRSSTGNPSAGPPTLPAPVLTHASKPALRTGPVLPRSTPTKIMIGSINLRARVDDVGLTRDGTIETPPYETANRAAWYRLGPSPGEPGPAVILGHVDSKKHVAVFFYLTRIRPGDRIDVTRADGRTAVFSVSSVEQVAKDNFPTHRVYEDLPVPELRLITCGGRYDVKQHAYLDNVIVFARMTGFRAPTRR